MIFEILFCFVIRPHLKLFQIFLFNDFDFRTAASNPMRTLHRAIQRISEPDIQNKSNVF